MSIAMSGRRELAERLKAALDIRDRRWRVVHTYRDCFVVSWLVEHDGLSEEQAVRACQLLCDNGYMHHVVDVEKRFENKLLYFRFSEVPRDSEVREMVGDEWVQEMIELLDIPGTSGAWMPEKSTSDAQAFVQALSNETLRAVKVVTSTTAPLDVLMDLLHVNMTERHQEWNETYKCGRVVVNLYRDDEEATGPADINIQYWRYALPGASDRDFLVVRRIVHFPEGATAIMERSIVHGLVPPRNGVIRCTLKFNVRYFKREGDRTMFYYMNHTDIRGWIPKFLTNAMNSDVSIKEIEHIRAICE